MKNRNSKIQKPKIRLFVPVALALGQEVILVDKQVHYLIHVMRLGIGDHIAVFNGKDGEFDLIIEEIKKKSLSGRIASKVRDFFATAQLTLVLPVIKKQAFDYALQKATECGVTSIQLIQTQYTDISKVNIERARSIVEEASEQSERLDVPKILPVKALPAFLKSLTHNAILYVGAEDGRGQKFPKTLDQSKEVFWMIGPEGGFSPEEFELLSDCPVVCFVDLGPRILKAETAVVSGLTLIQHLRE